MGGVCWGGIVVEVPVAAGVGAVVEAGGALERRRTVPAIISHVADLESST